MTGAAPPRPGRAVVGVDIGGTFTDLVLLSNGAVFSYLPIHALVDRRRYDPAGENFDLDELLYHDCKSRHFSAHAFPALRGRVSVYFKKRDVWRRGKYLFTLDWYRGNEQLHLVKLEHGQFCALPSHKMIFGAQPARFPGYRKMRQTWSVGR